MKVKQAPEIRAALRPLDDDQRRTVLSWFDLLKDWETNGPLRRLTKLTDYQDNYALDTPDDWRIFFTIDPAKKEIMVVDFSRPSHYSVPVPGTPVE